MPYGPGTYGSKVGRPKKKLKYNYKKGGTVKKYNTGGSVKKGKKK